METNDRLHALDALRAFALFLGIYFHASLSYMPGLEEWVVTDTSTGPAIWLVSGFSHLFRMSLFFFIAGYFARLVYHRKGFGYFVRDRAKRIALPLLMFLPVMLWLLGLIWAWGAQQMGRPIPDPPPLSVRNFPLTHLWFLYYLLLMYAAALAGRQLVVKLLDRSERIRQFLDRALLTLLKKRVAPFAFGLPLAIVALAVPEWNPATGIASPDKSLVPQLIPMVGFGSAFVVGWLCQRSMSTLTTMAERTTSSLWITLVCLRDHCSLRFHDRQRCSACAVVACCEIRRWARYCIDSLVLEPLPGRHCAQASVGSQQPAKVLGGFLVLVVYRASAARHRAASDRPASSLALEHRAHADPGYQHWPPAS